MFQVFIYGLIPLTESTPIGYELSKRIPHIPQTFCTELPSPSQPVPIIGVESVPQTASDSLFSLIYPPSPQPLPHEFLTSQ